jgi:hypothetical protein
MKEQFATYDIALKLKELGFNEPCFGYYDIPTKVLYLAEKDEYYMASHLPSIIIAAPLWQQVIKWFIDKYKILMYVRTGDKPFDNRTYYISFIDRYGCLENYNEDYVKVLEGTIYKTFELLNNKRWMNSL